MSSPHVFRYRQSVPLLESVWNIVNSAKQSTNEGNEENVSQEGVLIFYH